MGGNSRSSERRSAKRQKGRRQYLLSIEEVDGDGKKKRGEKEEMDGKLRGKERCCCTEGGEEQIPNRIRTQSSGITLRP